MFNFVIIVFVIVSVIFRIKKAQEKLQKTGVRSDDPVGKNFQNALLQGFLGQPPEQVAKFAGGSKDIDKLVTVYGPGAILGINEVSVFLKISEQDAQEILDQLLSSGKAITTTSASGKIRYKLI